MVALPAELVREGHHAGVREELVAPALVYQAEHLLAPLSAGAQLET